MKLKNLIMELGYRYARMPYENGPPEHLMELVESGRISPCRAIDLGCGTGGNAVFLAQHGFEVTGVDFAPSAIAKARRRAEAAGVEVAFVVDDLTNLQKIKGTFDFLNGLCPGYLRPQRPRPLCMERITAHSSWQSVPSLLLGVVVELVGTTSAGAPRAGGGRKAIRRIL